MRKDQPSATARLIARSLVAQSADPRIAHLVPDGAAELSRRFVSPRSMLDYLLEVAGLRRPLLKAVERLTAPGINLHYALRKCYLEEATRDALAAGCEQVVIFGAGFDTLALRLHKSFPASQFIEIDHPATQRAKTSRLRGTRSQAANLHFFPLDLATQQLEERLPASGCYRTGVRTLFIAEGLLMYLAPGAVERLFAFARERAGADSRFAFTFMEPEAGGRIAFHNSTRAVDLWLRLRGEPFKWGVSREQLGNFLAALSFGVREVATSETLRQRYLSDPRLSRLTLAAGEHVCVAERVRGNQ